METLIAKSNKKISQAPTNFQRFLLQKMNFKNRLIAIKGARGTGKTTLLLQYAKSFVPEGEQVLYVAMDDLFFQEKKMYEMADSFVKNNGKHLLLDEVHKYPGWSREIKLIYDDFPELNVIFTASSILDIYQAESDLSRRVVSYNLPELSLREFIELDKGIKIPAYSLETILHDHENITRHIILL